MPKSRVRKPSAYTPPPRQSPSKRKSPPWIAPAMVVCFVLGVIWLVIYYVSGGDVWGMRTLGDLGNLGIGFGLVIVGFGIATQWR